MIFELKPLSVSNGRDVYDMLQEIPASENGYANSLHGKTFEEYRAALVRMEAAARETKIIDGWKVPQSTYWLYVDGYPVGQGRIRHFLTDALREAGGHIGYAIRPGMRGRGYGKILLSKLIGEARRIGIDRALVTVHNDNTPSVRTALSCGGSIERVSDIRHYIWIDCSKNQSF